MTKRPLSRVGLALAIAAGALHAAPVAANPVAEFYAGKQVTLTLSFGVGGLYGLYGRAVADHMARYIPGEPSMVIQAMPGAGGLVAANYVHGAAPKDGTVLGLVFKDLAITQAMRPDEVRYDAKELNWIGRVNHWTGVLIVDGEKGPKSIDEAKRAEHVLGATGRSSASFMEPTLLNGLIGTRFRVITGYDGAGQMNLAMERGETEGWSGGGLLGFKTPGARRDWLMAGKVRVLFQTGPARDSLIPDVPLFRELASDPDDRRVIEFIDGGSDIGWSVSAPPGVPAARVAALRRAFDATMKDAAFLAELDKRNLDANPMSGREIEALIAKQLATDPAVVKRAREVLGF